MKVNTYHMGKYLLRRAFEDDHILPDDILWRQKAAFSDAVGHSMVDDLKEYAESRYSDEEFERRCAQYHVRPALHEGVACSTARSSRSTIPVRRRWSRTSGCRTGSWEGCDVSDPSARVLANYGASGE